MGAAGANAAWTMKDPPAVVSALQAAPSPGRVGKAVIFTSTLTAAEALHYTWDFGDGSTSATSTSVTSHEYAAAETYTVTLNATEPGNLSIVQSMALSIAGANDTTPHPESDFDGHGFPDDVEVVMNSLPTDANSTPFGGPATIELTTLSGLIIQMDFQIEIFSWSATRNDVE